MGHDQTDTNYITLTEATKIAPGRPSVNCVWRWCRKGVLSRGGDRVRLTHSRMGGTLFTTARWIEEFGRTLAEADTRHFDLADAATETARANEPPPPRRRRRLSSSQFDEHHRREMAEIDEELDAEGL